MNSRDRIIALSVGSTVALLVVFWCWTTISDMYKFRSTEIAKLEQSLVAERRLERQTIVAIDRMRDYKERSLPPIPSVARSAYQTWLINLVEKSGLAQPQVAVGKGKEERDLFTSQVFTVHGKGTLPQVVKLLHGFFSADYMHRITKLNIKPIKDSKDLDLIVDVEILSLEKAAPTTVLKERPSDRLALPKQEDYVRIISERNLFGPPNRAPQISGLGNQKAIRDRSVDIAARGSDPDKDKVTYKLVKSGADEARLDATSGKLSWTPRANGKYEFIIRATDDGLPAKSSKDELLVVTVEDPPVEPPRKLAFDDAKFTVLSAVIDVGGIGQIWLSIRPKGQTLKLGVGDKFEVGSVKGVITEIGAGDFTFESEGKEHKLSKGGILEQAVSVPQ